MPEDGKKLAIGAGVAAGVGLAIYALTRPAKAVTTVLPEEREKVKLELKTRIQEVENVLAQQELTQIIETAQAELIEIPVSTGVADKEELQRRIDVSTDPATGETKWHLVDARLTPEQIKGIMAQEIVQATLGMAEHYTTLLAEMEAQPGTYMSAFNLTRAELDARIAEAEKQLALTATELSRRRAMDAAGQVDELVTEWEGEFMGPTPPAPIPGIIPALWPEGERPY